MSRGVPDHLKATKAYGAEPYNAKYYEQVLTAISVRNCLMHAKGLLAAFRQAEALRTRIIHCKFLSSDLRKRRSEQERFSASDEVTIEGTGLGEQLVITNGYAHLACSYLRDYFCALCGTLNPNTALRPMAHCMDPSDLSPDWAHHGPISRVIPLDKPGRVRKLACLDLSNSATPSRLRQSANVLIESRSVTISRLIGSDIVIPLKRCFRKPRRACR